MSFLPNPRYGGLFGARLNPNGFATGARPRSPFDRPWEPEDDSGQMGTLRRPSYMTATNMTPSVDPLGSMAAGFTQVRGINPPVTKRPGVNWGGIAADFVAGLAGREGPYGAMLEARRQSEEAARRQEAQRQAQREEFLFRKQWERDNPAPVNNDTVNDYNFITERLGPEAGQQFLRNLGDPIVTVPLPNGQIYTGPRSQLGKVMAGAPAGPQAGGNDEWGDPVDTIPGGAGSNTSGGFPVKGNFGGFKRAIIAQESGGRYGVLNTEGSGAMGVGQVMPDTGKSLAKRVGLPWRPDLMQGNSPEARAYQDKITDAALQEAWNYGGGDIGKAASYYFAGPDKKGWGPKTRRYRESIVRRMGGN